MALINFDCPECGHNLEVDEGGAGFIVKCPECGNPLQIPELPRARRVLKIAMAVATFLIVLLLLAVNLVFWTQGQKNRRERDDAQQALGEATRQSEAILLGQDQKLAALAEQLEHVKQQVQAQDALAKAAREAVDEAETLSRELEQISREYLDNHSGARTALLRNHMIKVVEAAKNGLPAPPVITEVEPGKGIQGRAIVFPVLPGPDGQTLRENAEITGIEEDKVSVKFAGGTATYSLSELHPGVAAFLPVDRLLVLPRRQWASEVIRVHQMESARREERIAQLRNSVQAYLPAP